MSRAVEHYWREREGGRLGHKSTRVAQHVFLHVIKCILFSGLSARKRGGGREGCQWDSVTHGSEPPKGRNELEGSKVEDGSAEQRDVLIAWN